MKTKTLVTTPVILLVFALIIGCGPKPIPQESVLDTPDNHFNQGMREFDRGNLDEAMKEFERAQALDPRYAEAYSGMGLILAERGDFEKALDFADEGIDRNKNSIECRVIKGRILVKQRRGDDWVEDAVKEFDEAIELDTNSSKAHYYKGIAYKEAFMFGEAAPPPVASSGGSSVFSLHAHGTLDLTAYHLRAPPRDLGHLLGIAALPCSTVDSVQPAGTRPGRLLLERLICLERLAAFLGD